MGVSTTRRRVIALSGGGGSGSGSGFAGTVANYSALPAAGANVGVFYWVEAEEGSRWNPFVGPYHNLGVYYSNGITWTTAPVPYQATQANVNAGIITDQFVSPATLSYISTSAMGTTGALTYGGMTAASSTTVNIGALTGWVIDNETNPALPVKTYINYPGATGVSIPTIGSGTISYLLFLPDGLGSATLVWQNTLPTSAQRKTHIYASKASHPSLVALGVIGNETDYITSPLGLARDYFQGLPYINKGIHTSAGTLLGVTTTTGKIIGDGINFYLDRTNPNEITRTGTATTSFFYRTQLGGSTPSVTNISPGFYDLAGVITAVPGGTNASTIQYVFAVPFNGSIGFVIQYGQIVYASLAAAVSAVGKENFTISPNLIDNAILVGFIVLRNTTTDLNDPLFAQFFKADLFGQAGGGSGGTSVSTMQNTYNNSGVTNPQILTSTANDGVKIRRGSAADTDNVLVVQNGAGTQTWSVDGNGKITSSTIDNIKVRMLEFTWDGQGGTPTINTGSTHQINYTGTIVGWSVFEETLPTPLNATAVFDIYKDTYAAWPPVAADALTWTKPSLTAASKNTSGVLSIAVTNGDILRSNLDSGTVGNKYRLVLFINITN